MPTHGFFCHFISRPIVIFDYKVLLFWFEYGMAVIFNCMDICFILNVILNSIKCMCIGCSSLDCINLCLCSTY